MAPENRFVFSADKPARPLAARSRAAGCPRRLSECRRARRRVLKYEMDALVSSGDTVAVAWTRHLPNESSYQGLSLYRVFGGHITETRQALIGILPI